MTSDPESFARAARCVMAAGYVALRLADDNAGAAAVDRSSSGFVGRFDVPAGEVASELCELWGVDASLAPTVVAAGTVVGPIRPGGRHRTGLSEGIPLVAAPGDGPCGWLGAGAVDPGVTVDTAGTSDHVGICGTGFAPDPDGRVLICLASGVEGLWHVQGYTTGTGLTHRWFLEAFPGAEGLDGVERRAAELPPGSEERTSASPISAAASAPTSQPSRAPGSGSPGATVASTCTARCSRASRTSTPATSRRPAASTPATRRPRVG